MVQVPPLARPVAVEDVGVPVLQSTFLTHVEGPGSTGVDAGGLFGEDGLLEGLPTADLSGVNQTSVGP